ncbi:MAG: YrhB domain-containing protein [Capsulimonas sp.]|uniref:YrhB domain-containing protein n=1 Tax=Capsulimonas sp. TaxID=2494211 RepID=UPI00326371FE
MITKDEAVAIATKYIDAQNAALKDDVFVINDQWMIEKSYAWVFSYTTRRHLETGDMRYALVGPGPLMVIRDTGKLLVFGSGVNIELVFRAFELGFQSEKADVTITHVANIRQTALLLQRIGLGYVQMELEYGIHWPTHYYYSLKEIETMLQSLPVTFPDINTIYFYETLYEMRASSYCRYEIKNKSADSVSH